MGEEAERGNGDVQDFEGLSPPFFFSEGPRIIHTGVYSRARRGEFARVRALNCSRVLQSNVSRGAADLESGNTEKLSLKLEKIIASRSRVHAAR